VIDDGNDTVNDTSAVTMTVTLETPIPEPSALILTSLCLLGFLVRSTIPMSRRSE
jgi:hypothetical protein